MNVTTHDGHVVVLAGHLPHLLAAGVEGASSKDLHIVHVLDQDPHGVGVGAGVLICQQGALEVDGRRRLARPRQHHLTHHELLSRRDQNP